MVGEGPERLHREGSVFAISPQTLMSAMPPCFQRPDFSFSERSMQVKEIICVSHAFPDKNGLISLLTVHPGDGHYDCALVSLFEPCIHVGKGCQEFFKRHLVSDKVLPGRKVAGGGSLTHRGNIFRFIRLMRTFDFIIC